MSTTEFQEKIPVTIMTTVAVSSQKHQKIKFQSTLRACRVVVTSFQGLNYLFCKVPSYDNIKHLIQENKIQGSGHKLPFFSVK